MAKHKKATPAAGKFAGKPYLLLAGSGYGRRGMANAMKALVVAEGGTVVEGRKAAPDS